MFYTQTENCSLNTWIRIHDTTLRKYFHVVWKSFKAFIKSVPNFERFSWVSCGFMLYRDRAFSILRFEQTILALSHLFWSRCTSSGTFWSPHYSHIVLTLALLIRYGLFQERILNSSYEEPFRNTTSRAQRKSISLVHVLVILRKHHFCRIWLPTNTTIRVHICA